MKKNALDLLIIIISSIPAWGSITGGPREHRIVFGGLTETSFPLTVAIATLVIYLVFALFFKKIYHKRRWRIVGILCGINIVAVLVTDFSALF